MVRRGSRAPPGSSFELYAQAMLDHWLGKKVAFEFEREDGHRSRSKMEGYFAPYGEWPRIEREAMKEVRGRVLDVGAGPGRHSLYLQRRGFDVVAVDPSPTQCALARIRGVRQVYQASVKRLPRGLGTFGTVLMLGNNLGLAGDVPGMRSYLRELREITRKGSRLIGSSRIPGTWIEHHLPYVKRNIARGRPPGLLTLRARYKGLVGDRFDLLILSPDDLAKLAHDTGWELSRVILSDYGDAEYVAVMNRR